MWASLPCDLLVEIFRRLEATAVVRCAGVYKPWQRSIISNASCLHVHPDRFNPNLLVGFFSRNYWCGYTARLQYVSGPFEDLFAPSYMYVKYNAHYTSIGYFIPAAATGSVNLTRYDESLSSCDRLLLLRRWRETPSKVRDLCLCNPLTGSCRFLPAPAFGERKTCTYMLVTSHDYGYGGDSAVRVLAVRRDEDVKRGVIYQISSVSGEWGPVKRTAKFAKAGLEKADIRGLPPGDVVACGGSVYWIVRLFIRHPQYSARRRVFAIDVSTERTWTMELPEKYFIFEIFIYYIY